MAKLISAVQFSGSIGNELTAYKLGDMVVLRKKRNVKCAKRTAEQQAQSAKMKLVNGLLRGTAWYMKRSFVEVNSQFPFSAATSANMRNAVAGEYPNQYIDFDKVVVGEGSLPNARNARSHIEERGGRRLLVYEWDFDGYDEDDRRGFNDLAMPIFYDKRRGKWDFFAERGIRYDGRCEMELTHGETPDDIVVWLCMRDANGQRTSKSQRLNCGYATDGGGSPSAPDNGGSRFASGRLSDVANSENIYFDDDDALLADDTETERAAHPIAAANSEDCYLCDDDWTEPAAANVLNVPQSSDAEVYETVDQKDTKRNQPPTTKRSASTNGNTNSNANKNICHNKTGSNMYANNNNKQEYDSSAYITGYIYEDLTRKKPDDMPEAEDALPVQRTIAPVQRFGKNSHATASS